MDFCVILKSFPHNEHYLDRYIKFIKTRNKLKCGYTEKHHIIPKCIDSRYKSFKKHPWNKIALTGREHFIAHCILAKAYPCVLGLTTCLLKMHKQCIDDSTFNSYTYERIRTYVSIAVRIVGKNKHWICNIYGNSSHVDKHLPIPDGWVLGRGSPAANMNKVAMYYEDTTIYVNQHETVEYIKIGYRLGNGRKDYKTYYNPETLETIIVPADSQPEGWLNGAPKSVAYRYKNTKTGEFFKTKTKLEESDEIVFAPLIKNKKYYYDPVTRESSIFAVDEVIPEGWVRGNPGQFGIQRTKNRKWFKSPCGKISKMFNLGDQPDDWIPGRVMNS